MSFNPPGAAMAGKRLDSACGGRMTADIGRHLATIASVDRSQLSSPRNISHPHSHTHTLARTRAQHFIDRSTSYLQVCHADHNVEYSDHSWFFCAYGPGVPPCPTGILHAYRSTSSSAVPPASLVPTTQLADPFECYSTCWLLRGHLRRATRIRAVKASGEKAKGGAGRSWKEVAAKAKASCNTWQWCSVQNTWS